MNLTSYFITPYVAVILLDDNLGGRKDRSRIPELFDQRGILGRVFVAWLVGVLASVPFWESSPCASAPHRLPRTGSPPGRPHGISRHLPG